jgi:hypothetical protein
MSSTPLKLGLGLGLSQTAAVFGGLAPDEGFIFVFDHLNQQVFTHLDEAVQVDDSFDNE